MKTIGAFCGKHIEDMTRDDLISALGWAASQLEIETQESLRLKLENVRLMAENGKLRMRPLGFWQGLCRRIAFHG